MNNGQGNGNIGTNTNSNSQTGLNGGSAFGGANANANGGQFHRGFPRFRRATKDAIVFPDNDGVVKTGEKLDTSNVKSVDKIKTNEPNNKENETDHENPTPNSRFGFFGGERREGPVRNLIKGAISNLFQGGAGYNPMNNIDHHERGYGGYGDHGSGSYGRPYHNQHPEPHYPQHHDRNPYPKPSYGGYNHHHNERPYHPNNDFHEPHEMYPKPNYDHQVYT